jgi:pimeloyl-ACP methyl ester carboxylesterase
MIAKATLQILMIAMVATLTFGQHIATSIEGSWIGILEFNGTKLRLAFKVAKVGDRFQARFDSPDQGVTGLDIDTITVEGQSVKIAAKQFGFSFEGTLNETGDEINGTFNQGPAKLPLQLKRVAELPKNNRPQEPPKPYPYKEEQVTFKNEKDNVKLAGTLTLPSGAGTYPAVILISGSGTQDRDESIASHKPFLVLADYLTRNGIAVLRFDDRGIGGSETGSPAATSENFAEDVLTGIHFLKSRKEIRASRIGLIGHSEGGMIAPMVAVRSNDVAFLVLLAGLGQCGEDVIYTQTELIQKSQGLDPAIIAQTIELQKRIHEIIKTAVDRKRIEQLVNEELASFVRGMNNSQRNAFRPVEATIKGFLPMYQTPWFRYFITFDPMPVLMKVKVPVLALNGELDMQVASRENLELIAIALKIGKNEDFTIKSFRDLNHLFQTSKTGAVSEYAQIEETMSPEVLRTITEWVLTRTR